MTDTFLKKIGVVQSQEEEEDSRGVLHTGALSSLIISSCKDFKENKMKSDKEQSRSIAALYSLCAFVIAIDMGPNNTFNVHFLCRNENLSKVI